MFVPMHQIDDGFMAIHRDRAKMALDQLPQLLEAARARPQSLGVVAHSAHSAAATIYLADPQSADVSRAFQLCRQALNALFECAAAGDAPTVVPLGPGEPARYLEKPPASSVNASNWLDAFYLNSIAGDLASLRKLCAISTAILRASPTQSSEHYYLIKEALCAYVRAEPDLINRIIIAMKAVDLAHPDPVEKLRNFVFPSSQLEIFLYIATRDTKFGAAMQRAIELNAKYWSNTQDNARNHRGFISIELLGLTVLANDVGLRCDVETPYLPMSLIRAM